MFFLLIRRDIKIYWRDPQSILQPILFFILTICLFPIAVGSDNNSLFKIAPAALWIALLLACLLASNHLFSDDYQDGTLSQDIIHIKELWLLISSKIISTWIVFILPLMILLPIIILMLHIDFSQLVFIASLMSIGSFALIMIGCIGNVLTLNRSKNILLQFLIVIPFYFPILILGTTATHQLLVGNTINGEIAILAGFTLFSMITIIPFASLALKSQPLP